MHPKFEKQSIFLYPKRLEIVTFTAVEIWPMKFDNGFLDFEQASECEESEAEFYTVFVLIPDIGRDTIADCATKELAEQLQDVLLFAGKLFIREQ